ncbi:cation:proton antiporter [Actinomyces vulturis]|uniref:cation:proton antiporter n=1 Tax=Actinomyces vulturis TaxID=1857645 RepID=UPI0008315674|nr:cation:proton antiporter [Actinomyces vulturis]
MAEAFQSLFWVAMVAFVAPVLSFLIPRRIVPETVLLLVGGILIGPWGLGLAFNTAPIEFLREFGLAFLFLLAGYEIDVNELKGVGGHHAMVAWLFSLTLAFGAVAVLGIDEGGPFTTRGIAIAIAMTSTALGTLLPILRERGMLPTAVGATVLNHGAVGEVGPVILMALLLGSHSPVRGLGILFIFVLVTVAIVKFTDRVKRFGQKITDFIHLSSRTTAQTSIRITVLLLVALCALAEVFELDVVLGAFAAGFILRHALPEGNKEYEEKLDGLAYGFFIPLFFVTSGMTIWMGAVGSNVRGLLAFMVLLMLVRGVPVWLATFAERKIGGGRVFSIRQCFQVSLYSTTALPIIVAVTQVAVAAGAMDQRNASTLVVAGALSVLIMPTAALAFAKPSDKSPRNETLGVVQGPALPGQAAPADSSVPSADLISNSTDSPHATAPVSVAPTAAGRAATAAPQGSDRSATSRAPERLHAHPRHHHRPTVTRDIVEERILTHKMAQIDLERALWREQMRRSVHRSHKSNGDSGAKTRRRRHHSRKNKK